MRRAVLALLSLSMIAALFANPVAAQTPPAVSALGQKAGPYGKPIGGVQMYLLLGELQLWGTKGKEYDCEEFDCFGNGDLAFLFPGEPVDVLDASGTVLDRTQLTKVPPASDGEISFEFQALAREADSYTFKFLNGPSITATMAQLTQDGWALRRSFGAVPTAATPVAPPRIDRSASPASDAALGPAADGSIHVAAIVHLRGTEGGQFTCAAGLTDCTGIGKYKDIFDGAKAVATDPSGAVLAEAAMRLTPASTDHDLVFRALLTLPDRDAYSFQFGIRSGFPITRADFEKTGWTITLTLGPAPSA